MRVLHRAERWIAVDKPAGLVVHRGERTRDEPAALQIVRDLVGQHVYPAHRLDRATSGVLVLALDRDAARFLGLAFSERRVHKRYLAVVRGWIDERGVIDYPLREEATSTPADAVTAFARLSSFEVPVAVGRYATARYSIVEAFPHTGRMHQLRRHFAHLRHPIVGDVRYGDGRHNRMFRERFGVHRLLLHAQRLELPDLDGRTIVIEADTPSEFDAADPHARPPT
jgi:tRNA pseudouridine65 synthase